MIDLEFVGDYRNPQPLTARQRELGFDGQSSGDFTFGDFLDIINPLQHIPLVSTLYREITGDEISPHARIIGDTLFGGPSGFVAAAANVFFEEVAGEDLGEAVLAFFGGEEAGADSQVAGSETPGEGAAGGGAAEAAAGSDLVIPAAAAGVPLFTGAGPGQDAAPQTLAAPEDTPADGMLTGQAALDALFHDLRRSPAAGPALPLAGRQTEPLPLPPRQEAAKSYPLPPRPGSGARAAAPALPGAGAEAADQADRASAATAPLIMAQETEMPDIAGRMMEALDKYRMMSRQGQAAAGQDRPAAEETAWRSDPAPDDPWRFDPATPPGGS